MTSLTRATHRFGTPRSGLPVRRLTFLASVLAIVLPLHAAGTIYVDDDAVGNAPACR